MFFPNAKWIFLSLLVSPFPSVNCSVAVLVWRPKHQTRQSHGHQLPQSLPAIRSMRSRHGESGANGFRQNAQAVFQQISLQLHTNKNGHRDKKICKICTVDKPKIPDTLFVSSGCNLTIQLSSWKQNINEMAFSMNEPLTHFPNRIRKSK